jgi:glycosyltransferase involved in cell wall biosynthesis
MRRIYRQVHDCIFDTASMVQRASGLIAQTAHEASVYSQFGARPDQIREIPLGVNWNDFETLPLRGQFRRKIGLTDKDKLILFVGRVHWTKGLQLLIPAFADVARRVPHTHLAIVGWDHGFLNRAKQITTELRLSDRVFFLEPLFGSERLLAYVDADVFALTPCVYEETSLSALEACACGTSCVITKQCTIPGLDENAAGFTVDYDREQVANALWQILQQGFSEQCGTNARRLVQERFTIAAIAKEHERFFEDVADAR